MNAELWTELSRRTGSRLATATTKLGELTPEKGRPPPGGEEAEVVVYQPRGVGLMHTRHKPSDGHYTRANCEGRKSSFMF